MSSTPTDVVEGIAPFVERALDASSAREALGTDVDPEPEPRGDGGRSRWGAARHAGDRLD